MQQLFTVQLKKRGNDELGGTTALANVTSCSVFQFQRKESDFGANVYRVGLSCFHTHIGGAPREKGLGAAGLKDKHYCLVCLFVLSRLFTGQFVKPADSIEVELSSSVCVTHSDTQTLFAASVVTSQL